MGLPSDSDSTSATPTQTGLEEIPFDNAEAAAARWAKLAPSKTEAALLEKLSGPLFAALREAAQPDQSLLNIERYLDAVDNREQTLGWLVSQPRAIEILVRLFAGSPSLTELLVREPDHLHWLTNHRRLTEFPSREHFISRAKQEVESSSASRTPDDTIAGFRRYQGRELLRIAACDTFHLVDLKTATRQLSLLADALVEVVLNEHAAEIGIDSNRLAVLAFGKLGGLELNYSSDIDLLFLGRTGDADEVTLAQRTIRSLSQIGAEGFLYRVDMRLRPWGRSGPLVITADQYLDYLNDSAETWEKQALIKARPIAGDYELGDQLLSRASPAIFETPIAQLRENVLAMKAKIERKLKRQGRSDGHVKSGEGGIRDVEFVTQFLQMVHGGDSPAVRTPNTNDALLRLFDVGALATDQYRALSAGYLFLRVVEHALQLQDMGARHELPTQPRELEHLARRLDFPTADVFLKHYRGHRSAVRAVFDQIVGETTVPRDSIAVQTSLESTGDPTYREAFTEEQRTVHQQMKRRLGESTVLVQATPGEPPFPADDGSAGSLINVSVIGQDHPGGLALIAGLLQAYGLNVESAVAFPGDSSDSLDDTRMMVRWFIDQLHVRPADESTFDADCWPRFEAELADYLQKLSDDSVRTHADVARRVAESVRAMRPAEPVDRLMPIEVVVDDERDPNATVLQIRTDDAPGVLFNLTTALALARLDIRRVIVRTESTANGRMASDTFYVVDANGRKLRSEHVLELRAAIVLTTQFTNLLPQSPNAGRALIQFHEFLESLLARPGWLSDLATLQDSRVLVALSQLLGTSEFLWDDFLRFQHENLFPVVRDLEGLQEAKPRDQLADELAAATADCESEAQWVTALNAFKDREMLRVDMRLILNVQTAFNTFSRELTAVAEVVVAETTRYYANRFHVPLDRLAVCALGKCGGYEMGFASDIELMFLYDSENAIDIRNDVERVAKSVRKAIKSSQDGIFEIDLRLRPHGNAGSLAVGIDGFASYFAQGGAAWPFERQALVKMRPIPLASESNTFAERVVAVRDTLLYTADVPDVAAFAAMRERQVRQLVEADTFNVKLSPGGLVDAEYFVQLLQLRFGHCDSSLRTTNTREALKALEQHGVLTHEERKALRDAYRFVRRVINGLRMVRGDARDLTLPPASSDERVFLVRRLHPQTDPETFDTDFKRHTETILQMCRTLGNRVVDSSRDQSRDK